MGFLLSVTFFLGGPRFRLWGQQLGAWSGGSTRLLSNFWGEKVGLNGTLSVSGLVVRRQQKDIHVVARPTSFHGFCALRARWNGGCVASRLCRTLTPLPCHFACCTSCSTYVVHNVFFLLCTLHYRLCNMEEASRTSLLPVAFSLVLCDLFEGNVTESQSELV